ncbi:MAG: ferritin-like domain-containing protein [Verrucomicrobiota bacterium]|nr:ferritin-like domain-containing protein [Verrucomicrobiota bacterium]
MKINTLQELYLEELRDIYSAETQLVKALPKVAEAATSDELRSAIEEHLDLTKEHVERLDQIFESLGASPKGKKCKAMEGLIAEADELLEEDIAEDVLDAALIAAAQRVEHYEISVYGTLCTWAKLLEREEDADLLGQTLDEEKETDESLSGLAESTINIEANEEEEEEEAATKKADKNR